MGVVGVKFKNNRNISYFDCLLEDININDNVLCSSEKGKVYGKIVSINNDINVNNLNGTVLYKASEEDFNTYMSNLKLARDVKIYTQDLIKKLTLNMSLTDVEYSFDRNFLTINFTSDDRVDFRELVKLLASKYKARIELHQIGIRDKAKMISGLGVCGRELCCAGHLNKLETVSMNMAKNQNISLNPSKINGVCGRLLCCLVYEDSMYACNRKKLPKVGSEVLYNSKKCIVKSIDILNEKYTILVDNEEVVVSLNEK